MRPPAPAPSSTGLSGTYVHVTEPFDHPTEAFAFASELVAAAARAPDERVEVIGDFLLPPPGAPTQRDFQTLHLDFGLPITPRRPGDVGRYTALHVAAGGPASQARTRLVPLAPLLAERDWPPADELLDRLAAYGRTHGAWDDADGYTEGSLARIVEAAAGRASLPSVKTDHGFLCGTEFASLDAETGFFAALGLDIRTHQIEIDLQPGQLLVFDNLAFGHGRRGRREPGELHQRVYGHRGLPVAAQLVVRDTALRAFAGGARA